MLHNDKETFEQVILKVASEIGIEPSIIEKDYYVTLFLKKIVQLQPNTIFKGGTSGAFQTYLRHLLDVNLKQLVSEVFEERKPHEQCRSAKEGIDMNVLLQEIIDKDIYKKDYEDITAKMLFEDVPYIPTMKTLDK